MERPSWSVIREEIAAASPDLFEHAPGAYADLFVEDVRRRSLALTRTVGRWGSEDHGQNAETHERGAGVRIETDEKTGFVATTDLSVAGLRTAFGEASARAGQGGASRRAATFVDPEWPPVPADAPSFVSEAERRVLLKRVADAVLAQDDEVRAVEVQVQDREQHVLIATSEGTLVSDLRTQVSLRVAVTRRGVQVYTIAGGTGYDALFGEGVEQAAAEAVRRARTLAEAQSMPSGPWPIVLAAGWGGVWLHEAVGHALEADVVASGASPFAGRLGDRVAASAVTVLDDPTLPGGRGTFAFDDEGALAEPFTLIEKGQLSGFLADRWHRDLNHPPRAGRARRAGFRHLPLPRMTNLILQPGKADPEDLAAEAVEGLFVAALADGVTNPAEGRFAFDVLEAYRIERGRLTAPVTGVRLEGQVADALGQVVGVGNDLRLDAGRGLCRKQGQVVPVSVAMPTVLLHHIQGRPRS